MTNTNTAGLNNEMMAEIAMLEVSDLSEAIAFYRARGEHLETMHSERLGVDVSIAALYEQWCEDYEHMDRANEPTEMIMISPALYQKLGALMNAYAEWLA